MRIDAQDLRMLLGVKLRRLRHGEGLSLKDVAEAAGVSVSYLSEIEKGRKYPSAEKLLGLSAVLGVSYDDLVSLQVGEQLDPVKAILDSSFVREFPFEHFGIRTEDVVNLVAGAPEKAGPLLQTMREVLRTYDVNVEHFLFAALRSYQLAHGNHFPDLEEAAAAYRTERGWSGEGPPGEGELRGVLEADYGIVVDEETLVERPELAGYRSVFAPTTPPRLLVNGRLLPEQRAFIHAREIGYRVLGLKERAYTSSWHRVESFEQVLNNFRASYFAGALLIDRGALERSMQRFFARGRWDAGAFLELIARHRSTPEMFFYRLTQVLPETFGLKELYFARFHEGRGEDQYHLTKVLNMSEVPVPHGIGLGEHYCRRWPELKLLRELAAGEPAGTRAPAAASGDVVAAGDGAGSGLDAADAHRGAWRAATQRSHYIDSDSEFLVMAVARPLALRPESRSCVSLGFLVNDAFRRAVRFADDPAVPRVQVNLTCERCPLTPEECRDRVAPPTIIAARERLAREEAALQRVMGG